MKAVLRDRRRDEIMDAAVAVLAAKGYRDASMLEVARRAKASKETLYHWFGDKRGLYEAVIRRNAMSVQSVITRHLDGDAPAERVIAEFGTALLQLLLGDDAVAINRAAISEARADPQLARTLASAGRDATMPHFVAFLEAHRKRENWKLENTKAAAETFLGLLLGDLQIRRLLGVAGKPPKKAIAARAQRAAQAFITLHTN
jgi:AcrR family transcriptional regulator